MDEPTAALGPQETTQVGRAHQAAQEAEGIGIFLISHDIHDVFDLADRVVRDEERQGRWHGPHQRRHARTKCWA
jgi:ABC-type sugar transport system ATPase subunit